MPQSRLLTRLIEKVKVWDPIRDESLLNTEANNVVKEEFRCQDGNIFLLDPLGPSAFDSKGLDRNIKSI